MAQLGGTPILILKEGSERTRGKDAQSRNILAAKTIAAAVKSTLDPKVWIRCWWIPWVTWS